MSLSKNIRVKSLSCVTSGPNLLVCEMDSVFRVPNWTRSQCPTVSGGWEVFPCEQLTMRNYHKIPTHPSSVPFDSLLSLQQSIVWVFSTRDFCEAGVARCLSLPHNSFWRKTILCLKSCCWIAQASTDENGWKGHSSQNRRGPRDS